MSLYRMTILGLDTVIFLSILFLVSASSDMEVLSTVRKSLIRRKDIIPSWFYPEIPVCNLTGVDCRGVDVFGVNLPCSSSPLDLPFPSSIGELKHLMYLNLSQCGLTGEISDNIWSLENLEILDLSGNMLSGTFPLCLK